MPVQQKLHAEYKTPKMNTSLKQQLQHKIDTKTKPPGALGLLEEVALQVGLIQNTLTPHIINPYIVVFAADHGIAATGLVNPYPQQVTAQMVHNFVKGGAAINVFCRHQHIALVIVDAGVNTDFEEDIVITHAKINRATDNYLHGPAMSEASAMQAINKGKAIVNDIVNTGCNTIGFGEMGIGNTSAAALIMHQMLQLSVTACTGRGTGASDEQLNTKINTLETVSRFHHLGTKDMSAIELLSRVGGFEIAMMTGAYLEAARQKMVIVVDGFISTAALLLATKIEPSVIDCCIFAHSSNEYGHTKMLAHFKARPLLQLNMRLGEGTGAALAIPLIQSAVHFLNEMASFESAQVSEKIDI